MRSKIILTPATRDKKIVLYFVLAWVLLTLNIISLKLVHLGALIGLVPFLDFKIKRKLIRFSVFLAISWLVFFMGCYNLHDFLKLAPQLQHPEIKKGFYFLYFSMYTFLCIYYYHVVKERLIKCLTKTPILQ